MRVYRIGRGSVAGYNRRTHHADVIAESGNDALDAAKQGRVENWRLISHGRTSVKMNPYVNYYYVSLVEDWDHRDPDHPRAA